MARHSSPDVPGVAANWKASANARVVVWHFKGDALWAETIFFDNASLLEQIGAQIEIPSATGAMEPAAFTLVDPPLLGHGKAFE